MTAYYIAPASEGGSDAANGTSEITPWETVGKVNGSSFSPGDFRNWHRAGTWRDAIYTHPSSGNAGNYITDQPYGTGAGPIFSGGNVMTGFADGGSNIWDKTGVTTQPKVVVVGATNPKMMAASRAACTSPGDWFWSANTLSVYATSDPSGTVEAGQRNRAMTLNGQQYIKFIGITFRSGNDDTDTTVRVGGTTVSNISFDGCTSEYGAGAGFDVAGTAPTGIAFDSSIIRLNAGKGIQVGNAGNGTIRWCLITGNGYSTASPHHGIYGQLGNWTIEDTTLTNNGKSGALSHGIYAVESSNVCTVRRCISSGNTNGSAYKMRGSCLMEDNIGHSCNQAGVDLGGNLTFNVVYTLVRNRFYLNAFGGINQSNEGTGTLTVRAYHNSMYLNAGSGQGEIQILQDIAELDLRNNNCLATAGERAINIVAAQTGTKTIDYNCCWRADASTSIYGYAGQQTFAQWQALGHDTNGRNADPLYVNAPGGDLHLQSGSPCIDTGVAIAGINDDFVGAAPDTGAFEWPGVPPVPLGLVPRHILWSGSY